MVLFESILAILLQSTAEPPPALAVDDFSSEEAEILEAKADMSDRLTLPVMIDGNGPFRFFVDTGAQSTVLSRELGKRLGLASDGRATLVSVAKRSEVDLVQLNGLKLGSRVIDDISAPVVRRRDLGADGIIGIDTLQDLRVLLDFTNNTLAVVDSSRALMSDGYEIVVRAETKLGRMIVTNAEIDGVDTVVVIDTGAEASIGNSALQRRLRSREGERVTGKDVVGTQFDATFGRSRKLRVGEIILPSIAIGFSDALVFKELGLTDRPAILLGVQDLRSFDRVAIDFAERKVLFDLPAGNDRERPSMGPQNASRL
ncbi:retropepsin-like aspartic protease [Altererythrobacter sp. MF3-039]|uniref:retropepsin-like aspartic protease n=1 Tax=Altererythrobacter sp. MF3-039 TaxID=3252901 RepID=UPI00390C988E